MSWGAARAGKEFWLSALRHDGALIDQTATAEVLGEPLPDRPGLTVGTILGALGAEYRWVCALLERDDTAAPDTALPEPPVGIPVLGWWWESYRQLLLTLDRTDADQPAWNWAPQPRRAGFWHRRMAHLTALDRWDVQLATGTTEPLEAKAAADGIAELFDTRLTAVRGSHRHDPTGVVRMIAADTGDEWFVRLRSPGFALLDMTSHHPPRGTCGGRRYCQ